MYLAIQMCVYVYDRCLYLKLHAHTNTCAPVSSYMCIHSDTWVASWSFMIHSVESGAVMIATTEGQPFNHIHAHTSFTQSILDLKRRRPLLLENVSKTIYHHYHHRELSNKIFPICTGKWKNKSRLQNLVSVFFLRFCLFFCVFLCFYCLLRVLYFLFSRSL